MGLIACHACRRRIPGLEFLTSDDDTKDLCWLRQHWNVAYWLMTMTQLGPLSLDSWWQWQHLLEEKKSEWLLVRSKQRKRTLKMYSSIDDKRWQNCKIYELFLQILSLSGKLFKKRDEYTAKEEEKNEEEEERSREEGIERRVEDLLFFLFFYCCLSIFF